MRSTLSAELKNTMREQIAIISALGKLAVVRLFGYADRAKELSPDTTVISVICTAVKSALSIAFQSVAFYWIAQVAVYNCVAELQSAVMVATRMSDALALAVPMAKFIQHKDEKNSLESTKVKNGLTSWLRQLLRKGIERRRDTDKDDEPSSVPKPTDGHMRRHESQPEGVQYSTVFG